MFKLTIVFVVAAIGSVACTPPVSIVSQSLQINSEYCTRSLIKLGANFDNLHDQLKMHTHKISNEKRSTLNQLHEYMKSRLKALTETARDVSWMKLVDPVKTSFDAEIHCNQHIAEEAKKISDIFFNVYYYLLRRCP